MDKPGDSVFRESLDSMHGRLLELGLKTDYQKFAQTYLRVFDDASAKSGLYKIEIPLQEIIAKALRKVGFRNLGQDLIQTAMEAYYKPEIESWQLFPDAVQTLSALRDASLKMGIVSNAKSDYGVRTILRKFNLEGFFKVILTSASLRIRKPRSEIFLQALKAVGSKTSDTVFVGDTLEADIIGARMLGMRALHVLRKPQESTIGIDPDVTVGSLTEALNHITSWKTLAETGAAQTA
jgi:HAD superfamily hydrolase (TIGR01662 family)